MSSMRVSIDSDNCIGCGLCHERAPENLELAPGEYSARVTRQPVGETETEACREAVDYCPTGGITASESARDRD